jgi:hypothetical protein
MLWEYLIAGVGKKEQNVMDVPPKELETIERCVRKHGAPYSPACK